MSSAVENFKKVVLEGYPDSAEIVRHLEELAGQVMLDRYESEVGAYITDYLGSSAYCLDSEVCERFGLGSEADLIDLIEDVAIESGCRFEDINDAIHQSLGESDDRGLYGGSILFLNAYAVSRHFSEEPQMTKEQYKQAQRDLGFYGRNKLAGWLDILGISESSHKKYSSGILPVPPTVERLINAILEIQQLKDR